MGFFDFFKDEEEVVMEPVEKLPAEELIETIGGITEQFLLVLDEAKKREEVIKEHEDEKEMQRLEILRLEGIIADLEGQIRVLKDKLAEINAIIDK